MNANGLARLYDRLAVWERIALLIAAQARGDDAEYQRLFDASALRTWRFSEHLLAEQALHVLTLQYVTEQLDAAVNYFFALWQSQNADDPRPEDWVQAVGVNSYFFTENAEAWRRFCAELDIAPDALVAGNYHGWFLGYCEEHMSANAPTAEVLQARFRDTGRGIGPLVTAENLLTRWRNLLQAMTNHAPLRAGKGTR